MTDQPTAYGSIAAYLAEYDVRGAGVWAETPDEAAADIEKAFIAPLRADRDRLLSRVAQLSAVVTEIRRYADTQAKTSGFTVPCADVAWRLRQILGGAE